jgi:hypothetical protein
MQRFNGQSTGQQKGRIDWRDEGQDAQEDQGQEEVTDAEGFWLQVLVVAFPLAAVFAVVWIFTGGNNGDFQ